MWRIFVRTASRMGRAPPCTRLMARSRTARAPPWPTCPGPTSTASTAWSTGRSRRSASQPSSVTPSMFRPADNREWYANLSLGFSLFLRNLLISPEKSVVLFFFVFAKKCDPTGSFCTSDCDWALIFFILSMHCFQGIRFHLKFEVFGLLELMNPGSLSRCFWTNPSFAFFVPRRLSERSRPGNG